LQSNIVKAARVVDEALSPELEHPNLTAMRGSLRVKWIEKLVSGDKTELPILVARFLQERGKASLMVLADFDCYKHFLGGVITFPCSILFP
jgi:hypothetical protein